MYNCGAIVHNCGSCDERKSDIFSERTEELCRQKLLDEKNIDDQKSPELDHQNQNVGDERN
jgi:hypothetical protein